MIKLQDLSKSTSKLALGAVVAVSLITGGCESLPEGVTGALAGGAVGGIACKLAGGSDTTCALVAAVAGAVGVSIEKKLSAKEKERRNAALEASFASNTVGQVNTWQVPGEGSGSLELTNVYVDGDKTCRAISEDYVDEAGETTTETYTTCEDSNGVVTTF